MEAIFMKCKDCKNFKPKVNIEASKELSFDKNCVDGKCKITKADCKSDQLCECNGFIDKCK